MGGGAATGREKGKVGRVVGAGGEERLSWVAERRGAGRHGDGDGGFDTADGDDEARGPKGFRTLSANLFIYKNIMPDALQCIVISLSISAKI